MRKIQLTPSLIKRFWEKVLRTETCWLWTATKDKKGYGRFDKYLAHRVSWVIHFGPIVNEQNVLHNCPSGDNPACIHPEHLWLGTYNDNNKDRAKKHRSKYGEEQLSHKLTWEDIENIRSIYEEGVTSTTALADAFGVCQATISNIINFKKWKYKPENIS